MDKVEPLTTHRLRTGETLTVQALDAPLPAAYLDTWEFWWRDVRQMVLTGADPTSADRFFLAELDGEYVGSMNYCAAKAAREVAALEMVWTRPDQRRKGISAILMDRLLSDFRARGGAAMYLCTTNPHAYDLYYKFGFRPLVGDGMRYLAPEHADFDAAWFRHAGAAQIRPGEWGDLARLAALYNRPKPDWLCKDYLRRVFRDTRYESHYIRVWKPANEGRGSVLVLEDPQRAIVGIASLTEVDSYYEQQVQVLDFFACPAYLSQLPELLAATVEQGRAGHAEVLQAHVASVDVAKRQLVEGAGFRLEAALKGRLRAGAERADLLIYGLSFPQHTAPLHPPSGYYGMRSVPGPSASVG